MDTSDKQKAKVARKTLIKWGYPKEWVDSLSDDEARRQRKLEWEEAERKEKKGGE